MNHSKNKSSDMFYLLEQLENKKVWITLRSGKEFSGTLLLDHVPPNAGNNLDWFCLCRSEPVIHLHYSYGNTTYHDREYWILVSEIACLEYKRNETRDQD